MKTWKLKQFLVYFSFIKKLTVHGHDHEVCLSHNTYYNMSMEYDILYNVTYLHYRLIYSVDTTH